MKKLLILIIVLCVTGMTLDAQHKFGIRAGLNFTTFSGELELNEVYDNTTGFHFGVNYTYQMNTTIGLRAELLYTQRGTQQGIIDEAIPNIIKTTFCDRFVEVGNTDYKLDATLNYFSIPLTAHVRVTEKIELFGGISLDMLFSQTAGGTVRFQSRDRPEDIYYELRFDHNYRTDLAGQPVSGNEITSQIINGVPTNVFTIIGGNYYFTADEVEQRGNRFNFFDTNAIVGFNYFINSGFYLGLRLELGLLDLTNDSRDVSLREINSDTSFVFRSDTDRSQNLSLSFGFRF